MEKKKLKLSISGASKKTINSIEQAKSQSKNTVVIEKRSPRFGGKPNFSRGAKSAEGKLQSSFPKKTSFSRPPSPITSDFEKRKLAEQRATRRLKGETIQKENKSNKLGIKKRLKFLRNIILKSFYSSS